MIVSFRDALKFVGISIVCFCAVFVCTFFPSYYIDILPLRDSVSQELMPLYEAQLATAKMTTFITGGFLSVIAVVMLLFYIKLYIDNHRKTLGTLKAMGYSDLTIAKSFLLFGLSTLIGCAAGFALGWALMKPIYGSLTIDGLPDVTPKFHVGLLLATVIAPTAVFAAIAFLYAAFALHKPCLDLLRGETSKPPKAKKVHKYKDRPFLTEMCFATLSSKKMLAFFVTFSCFCFSAMVQMGLSMENLVDGTMGMLILAIGLVLSVVSMLMAMTSLVKNNSKPIAIMKAMGYSKKQCFTAVFACYIPLAFLGFAIGTVYQYGLLYGMINFIFKYVAEVPAYSFDIPVFFITLLLFVASYAAVFAFYLRKANKVTVKETVLSD